MKKEKVNRWEIVLQAFILVAIGVISLIVLDWVTDIFKCP